MFYDLNHREGKRIVNQNKFVDTDDRGVSPGNVRRKIFEVFQKGINYTFIGIKANPKAVEILPRYAKKIHRRNLFLGEFEKVNRKTDSDNILGFGQVKQAYQSILEYSLRKEIGRDKFTKFEQMILDEGTYIEDINNWPTIYLIPQQNESLFRQLIENLNENHNFEETYNARYFTHARSGMNLL